MVTQNRQVEHDGNIKDGVIQSRHMLADGLKEVAAARPSEIAFWDDFFAFDGTATVGKYALVKDGTGAAAVIDGTGGVLEIKTNASVPADNDEAYVSSITEFALPTAVLNIDFEARVKLTEANTDDANIIIGLSDTVGANTLLDNGAGPAASYDGFVFFKVDGGTVWQFEGSNAGTQDTEASVGAFTTATWHTLKFTIRPKDGDALTAVITPYVDGTAGTAVEVLYAGLAEMHALLGVKCGGANLETLLVDYVRVSHARV